MSFCTYMNLTGVLDRGWLSDAPCFCVWEALFPILKLNLSEIKFTSEIVWQASVLLVSLTPLGITLESFQLSYVSVSPFGNLKPPQVLGSLNGQFLSATPGRASVLINEWVSLWDHCTIWGLCLHHSHKFLSHLRKLGRVLFLFFGAKLWCNIFTFIPTNSIKAAKLRKSIRSASYFNHSAQTTQSPTTEQNLVSFNQASLSIFPLGEYFPGIFQPGPSPVSFNWKEAGTCYTTK